MRTRRGRYWTATVLLLIGIWPFPAAAQQPAQALWLIDDLYRMDGPQAVVQSPDGKSTAYIRRWIDGPSLIERFSLWTFDGTTARPLEAGQPDARSPVFSPDGHWIAVRTTRPRQQGWPQTPSVPLQSEAATDIWFISSDGHRTMPLAGRDKPYGRVFNDQFYGRVAFSPDGRRLAFIADDGREQRTPEELAADVYVVRSDQGEGYTGFGTAQVWVADLEPEHANCAATRIRRLTDDDIWYGDLQWSPDGHTLYCHANKSGDVEAVRHSINKNFDIWSIDVASGEQRQLTHGPGPEVSPRVSPDGSRLVCLSSPRKGPHADIYNLLIVPLGLIVPLDGEAPMPRVLFDHHASIAKAPHAVPSFPLPDECWDGEDAFRYTTFNRTQTDTVRIALEDGEGVQVDKQVNGDVSPSAERHSARQRLTPPGDPLFKSRQTADERVVDWTNDKLRLDGIITIPPKGKPPYPLVVYPHGGPHSRSTTGFSFTAQILAAHGYLVFQPNFRGSAGYGKQFLDADRHDFGGGDMRDLLTGIDSLIADNLADPARQFVYGISYGGFMTCWLVGHTRQFSAAAAQNAVTDLNVMWGTSDIQSWTEWEFGGPPWKIADAMQRHSPISYADRITTPTLILHSRDDRRCPLPMGRMFYQSLVSRGVPTSMVIYPDEGHGIRQPRHQADVLRRVLAWFAEHGGEPVVP
jgi:dipeptidyl aminopeptidase/acylaminoacyl peptidase